jgi:putative sigma-54 modulation protein
MDIKITDRHVELPDEVKAYALEKFSRIEKFNHGIRDAEVIFKNEDRKFHCEVIVHVRNKPPLVIDVAREEWHEAIDIALDKIERRVRKQKEKTSVQRRRRAGSGHPSAPPHAEEIEAARAAVGDDRVDDEDDDEDEE